jgi:hypothetical protein
MHHVLDLETLVEETDVVGDRARKQLVILHYDADAFPKGLMPEDAQWHSIDQDLARAWFEQPQYHLQQCRLSAAG